MNRSLILVVADAEPFLILLHQVLVHLGYGVVLAHGEREAMEQAVRHRPDAVLMDLSSQGQEPREPLLGFAEEWDTATPIIAVADDAARQAGIEKRFAGVVRKPIVLSELKAVLERCLGLERMLPL